MAERIQSHKDEVIIPGLKINFDQLENVLTDHPYFQLGLMEKSRRLQKINHIDSLKTLRKCAILFPSRSLLYSFLHENNVEENEEDKNIVKEILEVPKSEDSVSIATPPIDNTFLKDPSFEVKEEKIVQRDSKHPALEKDYLIEAVNQSIQIEASNYSLEESLKEDSSALKKEIKEDPLKVLSFSEWIGAKAISKEFPIESQNKLIDKFIQESPQISKLTDTSFYSPIEKGKQSISEESLPFSETLASIYVQQGNKALAIKAYRYLMLKNPQKSVYFADLIKKLEENN
jgi:hypothetical protein